MTPKSINQDIKRQLINPQLDMDYCERVLLTLDNKSDSEKMKLLETLQESMDIFKQKAKDIHAPMLYQQLCDKVKDKLQKCQALFQVTLEDVLSLINNTDIRISDVAWEFLSPQDISEIIENKVIGQKEYTTALALATYQHILRSMNQDTAIPKMNLLVYGPTGVGKTYSIQVLSRMLNIDFQIVNCNTLVQEGIVGSSISDAITQAYIKNDELTHLDIFFDEFDKLFKDGYYNQRVLQELLAYLDDDGEVSFRTKFGNSDITYKKFPTRNILVILGGVFDGLKDIVNNRAFPNKEDFTYQNKPQHFDFYDHVKKEDFVQLFNNNELLGRIGQFVRVKPMSRDMLLDIIKNETASPLIPYTNYFAQHNVTISLTDDGAERIVDNVQKEKLGVRGLKSTLGTILHDDMSRVKHNSLKHIEINGKYVIEHLPECSEENTSLQKWKDLSPQDISQIISKKVIGQEKYASALALAAYQHILRSMNQDTAIPKMNLLVYGPTGVGKTYSIQVLSRMLNIDLQIVNCNTLVQAGIFGSSISDAITHAYIKNNELTHLIIFFDEFDKLFKDRYYNTRILQELLAYLDDDGEVSFRTNFGSSNITYKKFPTRNILVILGGVFDGLKDIVNKRAFPNKIGFTNQQKPQDYDFYDYVNKKDFSQLFMNNELLGRIGLFVRVKPMSRDMLLDILKNETASPLIPYTNYFAENSVTISLTDDGAERIVDAVQKEKLGVRGLKSILEVILQDDMLRVKNNPPTHIDINGEYVTEHLPDNSDENSTR